jgi:pyrimidine-nucleoside phosphorylase
MRAVDLIRAKRDGGELETAQIQWLINAYTAGDVGDDQMAAFAMAVFFQSMTSKETAALTESMMNSGNVMCLDDIPAKKVDKHSTGGVGDKISICLAPLVAACGVPVPMISGRGLGHTGGTLDKLSAIPGFSVTQDDARFRALVRENFCALIGQTATLAPADKRLYALRDVTATVESIPLICASILSKKLAEGIDGLVLDVKVGSGAFMKTRDNARALANTLVRVGTEMGRNVRALITTMDQVLGHACGNANETQEAIDVLKGGGPTDVITLTVELGAEMLVLGEVAKDVEDGRGKIQAAISDGRGLEQMAKIIESQGGDPRVLDDDSGLLPRAQHQATLCFEQSGFIHGFDVEAIGRAAMILGAGRARSDDEIDLSVGLQITAKVGDKVEKGQVFAHIDYNDSGKLETMRSVLSNSVRIRDDASVALELIEERI